MVSLVGKLSHVCRADVLSERGHIVLEIVYAGELQSCIVIRFNNKTYAYINRCMHIPRKLNCELNEIFDDTGNYLRCSMHGIVYDPETGASQSTLCNSEKIKALRLVEDNDVIYISDKRAAPVPTYNHSGA